MAYYSLRDELAARLVADTLEEALPIDGKDECAAHTGQSNEIIISSFSGFRTIAYRENVLRSGT
jgi:hypothetical protein